METFACFLKGFGLPLVRSFAGVNPSASCFALKPGCEETTLAAAG